ncbi:MAG TPA: formylglycine-generating enzyme family protein, partial [Candidatus Cloacimonetes bacterium]|nr:formylglycine-generating enzyme family protein [Candidatus Cloacimonadota bacterium]HEX37418.1 formylglycine-generating enzyme family protein [Candidatus Cloacimonadota bacterium]
VEKVSWYDAVEFCNKKSRKEGLTPCYSGSGKNITCNFNANGYRLPTEAEWEYAARGGHLANGSNLRNGGYTYSGSDNIDDVAWYSDNSGRKTHPVGQKQPNELGLYDMSGNVWEWCWDWKGSYSSSSQTNPRGASSGSTRVLRGGGWYGYDNGCRVAYRGTDDPDLSNGDFGFRFVRTP